MINCRDTHKTTSNLCATRSKLLTDALITDAIMEQLINSFGPTQERVSFRDALMPTANAWEIGNQEHEQQEGTPNNLALHVSTPVTSYYECLRMSLLFSQ